MQTQLPVGMWSLEAEPHRRTEDGAPVFRMLPGSRVFMAFGLAPETWAVRKMVRALPDAAGEEATEPVWRSWSEMSAGDQEAWLAHYAPGDVTTGATRGVLGTIARDADTDPAGERLEAPPVDAERAREARRARNEAETWDLTGIASSTSIDSYGTEMSPKCLRSMRAQFNDRAIPLVPSHWLSDWWRVLGFSAKSTMRRGDTKNQFNKDETGWVLEVTSRIKNRTQGQAANDAMELRERLEDNETIGQSIGGWITDMEIVWNETETEILRIIIHDVDLDHLALTRRPANPDSWINAIKMRSQEHCAGWSRDFKGHAAAIEAKAKADREVAESEREADAAPEPAEVPVAASTTPTPMVALSLSVDTSPPAGDAPVQPVPTAARSASSPAPHDPLNPSEDGMDEATKTFLSALMGGITTQLSAMNEQLTAQRAATPVLDVIKTATPTEPTAVERAVAGLAEVMAADVAARAAERSDREARELAIREAAAAAAETARLKAEREAADLAERTRKTEETALLVTTILDAVRAEMAPALERMANLDARPTRPVRTGAPAVSLAGGNTTLNLDVAEGDSAEIAAFKAELKRAEESKATLMERLKLLHTNQATRETAANLLTLRRMRGQPGEREMFRSLINTVDQQQGKMSVMASIARDMEDDMFKAPGKADIVKLTSQLRGFLNAAAQEGAFN